MTKYFYVLNKIKPHYRKVIKLNLWEKLNSLSDFLLYHNLVVMGLLYLFNVIVYLPLIKGLIVLLSFLSIILGSAYLSLIERHIVAIVQRRVGPSITGGSFGLLQPLMDGLKLLLKEISIPSKAQKFLFFFGPFFTFIVTLLAWSLVDFDPYWSPFMKIEHNLLGVITLLVISSFGILISSWFSNNKFAMLSAIRSISLSISYGLSLTLIFLTPCYLSNSFNLTEIIFHQQTQWYIWSCFPLSILFWIVLLTEIKKIPFDVSESEAELASGYMIEYSGSNFAVLVISEYIYILALLTLFNCLFLGGMINGFFYFILKQFFLVMLYFVIRSILPNFRYDQIMTLHWKYILPSSLIYLLFAIYISSIIW